MPYRSIRSLLLVAGLTLLAGACHHNPPPPPPAPPPPAPVITQGPPAPAPRPPEAPPPVPDAPKVPSEDEIFAGKSLAQLNSEHPLTEVYFAYDKADLSDEARATLEKDAAWLKRWTSTKVKISGHADNRGTNEYNLALGERRASAVRDYLASLGVAADRMSIVSLGEESPVCREDTDACWAKNRRGEFEITAK